MVLTPDPFLQPYIDRYHEVMDVVACLAILDPAARSGKYGGAVGADRADDPRQCDGVHRGLAAAAVSNTRAAWRT